MPFFSKPLANLEFSDLNELLQERIGENIRLEFKSQPPVQIDMQKKLTGLANAYGGYLIVGAEAEGKASKGARKNIAAKYLRGLGQNQAFA